MRSLFVLVFLLGTGCLERAPVYPADAAVVADPADAQAAPEGVDAGLPVVPADAAVTALPDASEAPPDAATSGPDAVVPLVPGLQYNGAMAFEREVVQ